MYAFSIENKYSQITLATDKTKNMESWIDSIRAVKSDNEFLTYEQFFGHNLDNNYQFS